MDPFLTVEELQARLPWTLDEDELRDAASALDLLSELARVYGKATWTAVSAPRLVVNYIAAAAKRYLGNSDGLTQSRAGDETLGMTDLGDKAGSPYFTENEIKLIGALAGKSSLMSVPVVAWGSKRSIDDIGYVPVAGQTFEKPFPYFAGDEPW